MKPQEGIGCPSSPLRRGPDGLEFWLQGTMLSINQIPVICQFVCEKNKSCICGEMHCRGSVGLAAEPKVV
jgi:hypothetical protein